MVSDNNNTVMLLASVSIRFHQFFSADSYLIIRHIYSKALSHITPVAALYI